MFDKLKILAWEVSWKHVGSLLELFWGLGRLLQALGTPLGAYGSLLGRFLELWEALAEIFW